MGLHNTPCNECIWRGDYAGFSAVLVGLEGRSSLSLPTPAQKGGPVTFSCKPTWHQDGPCQHEQPGPKKLHCARKLGKPDNLLHFSSLTPPKLYSTLRHSCGFYHHLNIKPNKIYSLVSWNIINYYNETWSFNNFTHSSLSPLLKITIFNSISRLSISLCLYKYVPLLGHDVDYILLLD